MYVQLVVATCRSLLGKSRYRLGRGGKVGASKQGHRPGNRTHSTKQSRARWLACSHLLVIGALSFDVHDGHLSCILRARHAEGGSSIGHSLAANMFRRSVLHAMMVFPFRLSSTPKIPRLRVFATEVYVGLVPTKCLPILCTLPIFHYSPRPWKFPPKSSPTNSVRDAPPS